MIQAKIVADSKNEFGNRITTMVITMPRFILAEFNTHRMFSRNSASSRAIPFEKMVKSVEENPFIPIAWQKDHKGMQGTEYMSELESKKAEYIWISAKENVIEWAKDLSKNGLTKQLVNRLLEPFMWHTVIITATEWENFFALRCPQYEIGYTDNRLSQFVRSRRDYMDFHYQSHVQNETKQVLGDKLRTAAKERYSEIEWLKINKGQAEIHMMALAEAMWDAYNESEPELLRPGKWHIPFVNIQDFILVDDPKLIDVPKALKVSTAMCARVSYTIVGEEGKPANYQRDIELHDRLAKSGHWSPFEHCAKAMNEEEYYTSICGNVPYVKNNETTLEQDKGQYGWSGNFQGFHQYRKTFQGENKTV